MPTIPQRIGSAFAVLCGRYGDVTRLAQGRGQSRQSLYREAEGVIDAVDGTATGSRLAELERQVVQLRAQVHDLQDRLERSVELTPEKQAEVACVAQAEGVSLPVARRLLAVLLGPDTPSVATLGRFSLDAARRSTRLLEVLDDAARPRVAQAAADEIFSAGRRS
jgi:hypothetical protein